jgi:hypothetical protein
VAEEGTPTRLRTREEVLAELTEARTIRRTVLLKGQAYGIGDRTWNSHNLVQIAALIKELKDELNEIDQSDGTLRSIKSYGVIPR